jgi:hypothetical protein
MSTRYKYTVQTLEGDTLEIYPSTGEVKVIANTGQPAVGILSAAAKDDTTGVPGAVQTLLNAKQPLTGNTFAIAELPAAASNVGRCVYCTDGDTGSPCLAISDGTDWLRVTLGAAVAGA